jgi:hypothetical protein
LPLKELHELLRQAARAESAIDEASGKAA